MFTSRWYLCTVRTVYIGIVDSRYLFPSVVLYIQNKLCEEVYIFHYKKKYFVPFRSLCLAAQNGCEELMNKFGFQWPPNLGKQLTPLSMLAGTPQAILEFRLPAICNICRQL